MPMRRSEGWMFTMGLAALALAAAAIVPQLRAAEPPAAEVAADACLRLGPYECCYKEDVKK